MSLRSSRLTDNAIVEEMRRLERDLQEFAGAQPTSGQSGVLSYVSQNGDDWDLVVSIGSPSATSYETTQLIIDFTGDGSQQFPIVNAFADLRCNGTAVGNQPTYRANGFYLWDDGTRAVVVDRWLTRDTSLLGDALRHRWTIDLSYLKDVTLYFKATVAGSSRGSVAVTRSP